MTKAAEATEMTVKWSSVNHTYRMIAFHKIAVVLQDQFYLPIAQSTQLEQYHTQQAELINLETQYSQ